MHVQSQNSDQDAERKYYESLILGRMARLNLVKNIGESTFLTDYKTNYAASKKRSENMKEQMPRRMEENVKKIVELKKKLDELSKEQNRIEKNIGLSGSALIDCLVSLHIYSRSIKDGSNTYSFLVSILNGKLAT